MKAYINKMEVSLNIKNALSFRDKLVGMLFGAEAVLLNNTNAIHTFFMDRSISAIFLDKNGKVLKIFKKIEPNRIVLPVKNSNKVLEFNASFIKSVKISMGDIIEFSE